MPILGRNNAQTVTDHSINQDEGGISHGKWCKVKVVGGGARLFRVIFLPQYPALRLMMNFYGENKCIVNFTTFRCLENIISPL